MQFLYRDSKRQPPTSQLLITRLREHNMPRTLEADLLFHELDFGLKPLPEAPNTVCVCKVPRSWACQTVIFREYQGIRVPEYKALQVKI